MGYTGEKLKAWREANRDKIRAQRKARRLLNLPRRRAQEREAYHRKRAYHIAYYRENKERWKAYRARWAARRRDSDLQRKYGISSLLIQQLLAEQGGGCGICGRSFDNVGKRGTPAVDHEHGGDVRGILCMDCNRGLGAFKDQPQVLLRAIEYLGAPPARAVLTPQLRLFGELIA